MAQYADLTGGCLCGRIRYRAKGEIIRCGLCHCHMCQRVTGSAFLIGVGLRPNDVRWDGEPPAFYQSSPPVERGFCPTCGSTISYHLKHDKAFFLAGGTLDNPSAVAPTFSLFTDTRFSWLDQIGVLPAHSDNPYTRHLIRQSSDDAAKA